MLSSGSTIASFEDEGRRGLRMASLIKELAYIVIDEGDVEAWSGFGTQLLGFEVQRHRSVLTMKMDPSPPRYFVLERKSNRSEEHTSELQSLMRISYAVFSLKKKKIKRKKNRTQ